eukprot:1521024-Rhodomonas_salina.4
MVRPGRDADHVTYAIGGTDMAHATTRCYAIGGTYIAYAATRCYGIGGTDIAYAATRCYGIGVTDIAYAATRCYAIGGTDIASASAMCGAICFCTARGYAPTTRCVLCGRDADHVIRPPRLPEPLWSYPICLQISYTMSGTDLAYGAIGLRTCYAISSTHIAQAAIKRYAVS